MPEKLLRKIDILHKTAERRLKDFLQSYTLKPEKVTKGWSLLRTYQMRGTSFLYSTDPIAPDSIVVMRPFVSDTTNQEYECQPMFFWVSPERDDKWHLPFIFQTTTEDSEKVSVCLTSNVVCSNIEEARVNADSFFTTSNTQLAERGMRFEIDVWKQGKTEKSPKLKMTRARFKKLILVPQKA